MICWQHQKLLFFLNISECSLVARDQGQRHLFHHTEIHQLSKKWALPATQECQMQNICCLLFSPGKEMIVLVTRQSCATEKKRTGTECMSCLLVWRAWTWRLAPDHETPLDKGPKCKHNSVSLILIICSASGLGDPSCICSVQALPDGVGGSQRLIWHPVALCKCHLGSLYIAWGLPDEHI